jgi:hypothetical protein
MVGRRNRGQRNSPDGPGPGVAGAGSVQAGPFPPGPMPMPGVMAPGSMPQPMQPTMPAAMSGNVVPGSVSHDVAEAVPLYTSPIPFEVTIDHQTMIVYVTQTGYVSEFEKMQLQCLENLAREASRRGCDAVYSVRQSMTATGNWLLMSFMGTGAQPSANPDRAPGTQS